MKITSLYVKDFLGAALIDVPTPAPVQLFCGANGAGKSSLRDAVALALTADLGRVSLKKDAAQLIRTGAGSAVCEVRTADGDTHGVTITASGKMANTFKGEVDPVLAYVLDSQRFARLDDKARRGFLFGLLGVKMDAKSIGARLAAMGCDAGKVDRVAPLLRAGFAAAAEDAREKAKDAKSAWRGLTGETYGEVKAATWQAPSVAFFPQTLATALHALAGVDTGIASAQQTMGALEAAVKAAADARTKMVSLKETAALLVRRQVKLATDETAMKSAQDALDATTTKAGNAPRVGLVHDLAELLSAVVVLARGYGDGGDLMARAEDALTAYEALHGKIGAAHGDSDALARLPALTAAVDLMASAVRNSMRDVKLAQEAETEIKVLEDQIAGGAGAGGAADDLGVARQHLSTAIVERKTCAAEVDTLRAAKAAAEGAAQKTAQAMKHHADVEGWNQIADALGSDGIPAVILAEALGPINARLAQNAGDTEWPPVVITADMAITFGGRPYHLVSESERYRADAMISEVVSFISGARLLVLDRFDVLDLPGRSDLLAWLDVLADNNEIDTALIFGTLKAKPTGLGESTGAHEIVAGSCVEPALEEA